MSSSQQPNEVTVGHTRLGKILNVSGSGTVARVSFKAIAEGETNLRFSEVRFKEQFVTENGEYLLRTVHFETNGATIKIDK